MRRLLALLLLILTVSLASAVGLNLTMPGQGPYKFWTDQKLPTTPPESATLIENNPTAVTLPDTGYLAVLDTQSGNMAIKPVKGLKGSLNLSDADFSLVSDVKIDVIHDGRPVQSASVSITDGARTQTGILDPSLAGEMHFYGVKQGHVEVKVQYVSNGKQADPLILVADLDHTRADKSAVIKAAVPNDVATIAPAASTTPVPPGQENLSPGSGAPKPPQTVGTLLGKILTLVLGFLFVCGIIGGLFWLWKAHPKAISEKLTSLGVQIPKDPNEAMDDGPVLPAAPIRPEPPQKIILEDSAPTPLATASTAAPMAQPVASGPASRLVAETGGSVDLPDGTTLIGREATLGLAVPDPSTLSRRHAELVRQGGHLLVRDLGSTNGTFVNGRKIDSDTPLNAGDNVQFGAVRFRVEA